MVWGRDNPFFSVPASVPESRSTSRCRLELRLPRLFCSLTLLVAYFVGRSLLWHQITVRNGITFPLRRAIPVWFYSALGKYVPGKVFTLLARLHFYGKENCSAGRISLCYFLETVFTLLAYILTALLALVLAGIETLQNFQPALIVLLIVFAASLHPRILSFAINLFRRIEHKEPIKLDIRYRDMVGFVGMYTLNWFVMGAGFFLLTGAIYSVEPRSVIYLSGAFSVASLAGILSVFAPSGLGVREGVLAVALAPVLPTSVGVIIALVSRVWFTIGEFICIGVALVYDKAMRGTQIADIVEPGK